MALVDVTTAVGPWPTQLSRCDLELLTVTARTTRSGAVLVAVRGDVDMTTCALLCDRLVEQLRSTHHLVVDLGEVKVLCAAGLTALVVVREMALLTGTGLCVVANTRQVLRPLMITGLDHVFDLHTDVAEALSCSSVRPPASPVELRLADPRRPGDLR